MTPPGGVVFHNDLVVLVEGPEMTELHISVFYLLFRGEHWEDPEVTLNGFVSFDIGDGCGARPFVVIVDIQGSSMPMKGCLSDELLPPAA
jgi:hypothetical protein